MPSVQSRYAVSGDVNDIIQRIEVLHSIQSQIEALRVENDFNRTCQFTDVRIRRLQRSLNKLTISTQLHVLLIEYKVVSHLDFSMAPIKTKFLNICNLIKQMERSLDILKITFQRQIECEAYFIEHLHQLESLQQKITLLNRIQKEILSQECCSAVNGKLDCFVTNYSLKRSNAKYEGIALPFTTTKNGYKILFKIYTNGFGTGVGTHLSVGIAIMAGRFDALLPWPFHHAITIRLINQFRPGDNIEVSLEASENSDLITRPLTEINQARFVDRFVALSVLLDEANGFLVNDALIIQVFVDTRNMVDAGDVVDTDNACKNMHSIVAQATD